MQVVIGEIAWDLDHCSLAEQLRFVLCPPPHPWATHDHHRSLGPFPPDAISRPHAACCWLTWFSPSCVRSATRACRSLRAPPPAAVFHLIRHDAKVVLSASGYTSQPARWALVPRSGECPWYVSANGQCCGMPTATSSSTRCRTRGRRASRS